MGDIGKEALAMADGFDMPRFSYRYDIIDMHGVDCEDLLRQDSPDAWVMAILCDFKHHLPREVVHTILARLAERFGANLPRLREYVDMLDILASNRDLNLNIREELKMLTIDVEKLATYQLGMEKGMEKGAYERNMAIAKNLLERRMEPDLIAAVTGLSLAEIEGIRDGRLGQMEN